MAWVAKEAACLACFFVGGGPSGIQPILPDDIKCQSGGWCRHVWSGRLWQIDLRHNYCLVPDANFGGGNEAKSHPTRSWDKCCRICVLPGQCMSVCTPASYWTSGASCYWFVSWGSLLLLHPKSLHITLTGLKTIHLLYGVTWQILMTNGCTF